MSLSTTGQFSQHSDVLGTTPATDAEVQSLVAELRRRGNLAFKNKSFMESDMLYTKAIEVLPTDASILANRSAARLAMKNFTLALEDANSAAKLPGSFPKAHFRRGQALAGLGRAKEAQQAYEQCAAEEEALGNADSAAAATKEAAKQAAQLVKDEEEEKKKKLELDETADDKPPALVNTASVAPAKKKKPAAAKKDEEEEEEVSEAGLMKGYKVLDNGKKTTFFHREISPEEKRKLELVNKPQAVSSSAPQPVSSSVKAGSQWNSAGTFEEKDLTKQAIERLTRGLKGQSALLLDEHFVEITSAGEFDGSASHTVVRGARKTPFDFTFVLDWSVELPDANGGPVTGKLFCSQCTNSAAELEAEFEVRWENRAKAGKFEKPLLDLLRGDLQRQLRDQLVDFSREFAQM